MSKTRVVSNPNILGGIPIIEGTRVPVDNVLAEVKAGMPPLEIFSDYPSLPPDGIKVCIEWDRSGRHL